MAKLRGPVSGLSLHRVNEHVWLDGERQYPDFEGIPYFRMYNAYLPEAGFAGEDLPGEHLTPMMKKFQADALAQLDEKLARDVLVALGRVADISTLVLLLDRVNKHVWSDGERQYRVFKGIPYLRMLNAYLPDAGFAGEELSAEQLTPMMKKFQADALAQLSEKLAANVLAALGRVADFSALVHAGPLQQFQMEVLREAGLC